MKLKIIGISIMTLSLISFGCKSKPSEPIQYNLKDANLIANINGDEISTKAFNLFSEQLKKVNQFKGKKSLLEGLITNQLLARHYRDTHKGDLPTYTTKGIENEYLFFITQGLSLTQPEIAEAANKSIIAETKIKPEQIKALFPSRKGTALINPKTFEQATQSKEMKAFILAKYKFIAGKEQTVSLYDLYKDQNVQVKTEILNGNVSFISKAIKKYINIKYLLYLGENPPAGTKPELFKEIKGLIANKHISNLFLGTLGFKSQYVDTSSILRKKIKSVPAEKIHDYYVKNKEKFKEVKEVRARHITVKDEKTADMIYDKLQKGASFTKMVKEYSVAADKTRKEPGMLPLIKPAGLKGKLPFLFKMCLMLPEGKISRPYRTPGNYEIIIVDKRVLQYRDPEDKAVQHEIARKIAHQYLQDELTGHKKRLLKKAAIRINKVVLGSQIELL